MKKNNKNLEEDGQAGKWLSTFNDMVTLLLTFFVLIISMSTPDTAALTKITKSISTAFGLHETTKKTDGLVFTPFVVKMSNKVANVFGKSKTNMTGRINKLAGDIAGLEETSMDVVVIKEGVSVILGEDLLFKSGMAEIEKKKHYVFDNVLGIILRENDYQIRVEGHTDDVPIRTARFSSNWELSIARATNVVKYFISEGVAPERLSAAGYADSKPLLPNVDAHNRGHNRRVEIILTL